MAKESKNNFKHTRDGIFSVFEKIMASNIAAVVENGTEPRIFKTLSPARHIDIIRDYGEIDPAYVARYNATHLRKKDARIFLCTYGLKKVDERGLMMHQNIAFLVPEETLNKYLKATKRVLAPTEMACFGWPELSEAEAAQSGEYKAQ